MENQRSRELRFASLLIFDIERRGVIASVEISSDFMKYRRSDRWFAAHLRFRQRLRSEPEYTTKGTYLEKYRPAELQIYAMYVLGDNWKSI